MCRFVAYQGHPVLLADLMYRPRHSLVAQSATSEEMSQTFNGDGFGVGWYAPEIDAEPCVVKAAVPAWSSENARSLSAKIRSGRRRRHARNRRAGVRRRDGGLGAPDAAAGRLEDRAGQPPLPGPTA